MTYVIAIANEKGGVAKTTTALSLGAALVEIQKEVLLVDLDPQANLSLGLGIRAGSTSQSVADVLMGNKTILGVSQETGVPGLDLVAANHELMMAERFLSVRQDYESLLRQALRPASIYDVILLDCPPALGPLTRSALTAANLLIIPTQCEFFSAHALRNMLNLIREVRQHTNPNLRYRLLLTIIDRRNRIHRSLHEQVRAAFGNAVFETVIEMDTRVRESQAFAQPITVYAPKSRSANQYRALAQELRHYAQEILGSPPSTA